jgi:hypothetical protein
VAVSVSEGVSFIGAIDEVEGRTSPVPLRAPAPKVASATNAPHHSDRAAKTKKGRPPKRPRLHLELVSSSGHGSR